VSVVQNESLTAAFQPLLSRLFDFLTAHPDIRAEVGSAARAVAGWCEAQAGSDIADVVKSPAKPVEVPVPEPSPLRAAIPVGFLIPIRSSLDEVSATVPLRASADADNVAGSPAEIAARCRLKATVARALVDGAASLDFDARGELMRQANELRQCRLWMLELGPKPPAAWRNLADAYEAAATAAELLADWDSQPEGEYERKAGDVLQLAAEAQAVLYAAVEAVGSDRADFDQIAIFKIIRDDGERAGIFIKRFLRKDDKADSATGADVRRRMLELMAGFRKPAADPEKEITRLLKNLRFKLKTLETDSTGAGVEWSRVFEVVVELMEAHRVPPSHIELRNLLIPAIQAAPSDDIPPAAAKALREASRYADELAEPNDAPIEKSSWSAQVTEVRGLIAGKTIVFIGGEARPHSKAALEEAFGLREVNWICTPEHTSTTFFEAPIARDNVAVVILATRWSSHDYQNVKEYCVKYGKHFVKLPSGYHPNQVAAEILDQIGDKLRAAV